MTAGPASDPTTPPGRPALPVPDLGVRPVADDDAAGLIDLVGAAYAEHPGCVLDLPGVDADLVAPGTSAADRRVDWWVVTDADRIVASVAHGPVLEAAGVRELELKRLYVAATHRRRGLASALTDFVVARARALGADTVVLWSDTRFVDAHRLYEGLGFARATITRELDDPSCTCEAHFRLTLA